MSQTDRIAFVIFGVTGDLTRRKLIPALYELCVSDRLPMPIDIIGFARRDLTDASMKNMLQTGITSFA
ncbi:MAG TPA: glucose-6-phosphate dehydrogenase, partial [Anaerolineaceae bacterium]|nr:glucose-6-phosphate dehydrogenase [Anaerolineaceae bacterium]